MEERKIELLIEIGYIKRLDPHGENVNSFALLLRLEYEYNQIVKFLDRKNNFCNMCSEKFTDTIKKNYYEDLILCNECIESALNSPVEEDTEMNDLSEALSGFNTK
jgi:hypothetical protein